MSRSSTGASSRSIPAAQRLPVREGMSGTAAARRSTCRGPAASAYPCPTTTRRKSDALRPAEARRGAMRPHPRARRPATPAACCGQHTSRRALVGAQSVTKVSRTVAGLRKIRNGGVSGPGHQPGVAVKAATFWRCALSSTRRRDRAVRLPELRDDRACHRNRAGDGRAARVVDGGPRRAGDPRPALAPAAESGGATP